MTISNRTRQTFNPGLQEAVNTDLQQKLTKVTVQIPKEDYQKFRVKALQERINVCDLFREWVKAYVDRPSKE